MDKEKAKKVLKEVLKTLGIALSLWVLFFAVMLITVKYSPDNPNTFLLIALVITFIMAYYIPLWYLIHKYVKRKPLRVALYILPFVVPHLFRGSSGISSLVSSLVRFVEHFAYFMVSILQLGLIVGGVVLFIYLMVKKPFWGIALLITAVCVVETVKNLGDTQRMAVTGSIILIVLCAVLLKAYQQKKRKDNGELARIKGQHIYGLSAQSEETVKAIVYQDKIVFKYTMSEETRSFQHITDVSSRSERTFVGQTTIAHRKTNLTSAISLGPRGGVTRTWIRTPETTYTTQDNYKNYWYLSIDTEDGSIILRLNSYSNLDKFVGQCKACITQSNNGQNYADEYENSAEDDDYARPYARGRAYAADHSNDFESNDEAIDIDKMDGATFEHFCADLLRVNGWTDVRVTPASGDHGIDITAEKDDIKWGFQCKRWNDTKVDAVAIGQTYKGKALYECDMVAVITTSTLTAQAEGEAKQLGIKVWGRGKIRQLMSNLDNADDYYLSA